MLEKLFKKGKREKVPTHDAHSTTNDNIKISDCTEIESIDTSMLEEEYAIIEKSLDNVFGSIAEKFIKETLPDASLSFRLNFILNTTTSNPLPGVLSDTDKSAIPYPDDKINWDMVNKILFGIPSIYGDYNYNLPKEIHSREELIELRVAVICAAAIGPWREERCKDCGKMFYLNHGETLYYLDRELKLPKRCKECRDRRRSQINKTITNHNSELT